MDKKNNSMPDLLKTDETDINKYPDHMKTKPNAEGSDPSEMPMEDHLKQDPQAYEKYPDNLKTNPEK